MEYNTPENIKGYTCPSHFYAYMNSPWTNTAMLSICANSAGARCRTLDHSGMGDFLFLLD